MAPTDDPVYRTRHRASVAPEYRAEGDGSDDDMMALRMPIASTGDVRNEGDDPLTRAELAGMATQINAGGLGVFSEHGQSGDISDGRYSQTEKLGYWSDAEVDPDASADDEDLLMATANMPEPRSLPAATNAYRTTLAIYKEQAKRDIPMDASIGWRADEDAPGGNDLMEVSIVGIGADPRTTSDAEAAVVARAAVDAGADPDALVREVRAAVGDADADTDDNSDMTDDDTGGDDPGTDDAQDAPHDGDGSTDTGPDDDRAPADLTEERLATFAAVHYDGMDESDLMDAADAADAEFVGAADVEELYDLVSVVVGAEYDAVAEAMDDLMGDEQEGDKPDEDDEDDDMDEQDADAGDGDDDADTDGRSTDERLDDLEATIEAFRNGEIDPADDAADGTDPDDERDADGGDDAEPSDERSTDADGEPDAPDIRVSDL
jgi:hypothetical protein